MKHTLQLRVSQQLTLTPQLQQSIRLLQLSTLELNQELERFLAENPLLEREVPAPEAEGPFGAHDWLANDRSPPQRDDEDYDGPQIPAEQPTLREHLLAQ